MKFIDKLEQKVVFPVMRIVSLICILALLVSLVFFVVDNLISESHASRPIIEKVGQTREKLSDNISAIITEIEAQTKDPVKIVGALKVQAIGALTQIQNGIVGGTLKKLDWLINIFFILGSFALIGIFCITLSLLSIERNTRNS